jgi:hypothetical protein
VVAFSDESAESAKAILERARREFVRFYFDGEHGERFQATFSAGISCYPQAGQTVEEVFKVADRRLYAAKEAGRNQIIDFDLGMISDVGPIDTVAIREEEPITEVFSLFSDEALQKILKSGAKAQSDTLPQAEDRSNEGNEELNEELNEENEELNEESDASISLTPTEPEREDDTDSDILPFFTKD